MKTQQKSTWYGYVYLLQCGEHFKIGYSLTPHKRVRQLRTGSPHPIRLIHELKTPCFKLIEKQLHHKFRSKRGEGEWFVLTPDDVDHIKSLDSLGNTPEQARRIAEEREREHANRSAEQKAEEDRRLAILFSGAASGVGSWLECDAA